MNEYNIRDSIRQNEESIDFESNKIYQLEKKLEDFHFFKQKCIKRYNQLEEFIYNRQNQYGRLANISNVNFYKNTSNKMSNLLQGSKLVTVNNYYENTLREINRKSDQIENEITLARTRIRNMEDIVSNLYYELGRLG